jgi:glycosyltransferase involved in cell wall biosynthesis
MESELHMVTRINSRVSLFNFRIVEGQKLVTSSSTRTLSVIVPVYNGRRYLRRCLQALTSRTGIDCEITVVDDCSTDDTCHIAQEFRVNYLKTGKRAGPGFARNLGAQYARGEILVFVDADVVLRPDSLRLIGDAFHKDPELAALFGSYDEAPAETNFVSQYKNLIHHYVHQSATEIQVSFWAGCGAIRKNIFVEIGGFDVIRFPDASIEDIELGLRLSKAKKKIRLDKNLQGKHLKKWTLPQLLYTDVFCRAIPWTRLILESRTLPRNLNLNYTSRASSTLVGILFLCATSILLQLMVPDSLLLSWNVLLTVFAVLILILAILNWPVYLWLARRRGLWFAMRAVWLHWFYYFYSGCAFVAGAIAHYTERVLVPNRAPGLTDLQ